jgi:hypothetical protein
MGHDLPEHVQEYLLRRTLSHLPESVIAVLASLSEDEINVLDRVGAALDEAGADIKMYYMSVH